MTLIELLISLAIIGLMVGIAFPIFSYYQRRSKVDTDIRNFVSLFNYARALQNNPDNFSRTDPTRDYSYEIKFTNNGDTIKAELYSLADTGTIIDKVDFSEDINVRFQDNSSNNGDGLTMNFTGSPPREIITCSSNCDTKIEISLAAAGSVPYTRTATILNSIGSQLLSIDIK